MTSSYFRLMTVLLSLTMLNNQSVTAQKLFKFSYDAFKDVRKLRLMGDAKYIPGSVQLTDAIPFQRGACWYGKRVPVAKGFTVQFKMKMSRPDLELGGADGIAFVIQNDPRNLGLGRFGEQMGYGGIANALAIEFDTYDNGEGNANHLSIQTNGRGTVSRLPMHTIARADHVPRLQNSTRQVKIAYDTKAIKVYIDGKFVLKRDIDLSKLLELKFGKAWIGFTSATAKAYARQEILDWRWQSVDIPMAYRNNIDVPALTGCDRCWHLAAILPKNERLNYSYIIV